MAMRELVDGDCGGRNPVLKAASHFVQDKGFRQEAFPHRADARPEDVMVREFLEGIPPSKQNARAFNMGNMLEEMRALEGREGLQRHMIQQGPNIADHAFKDKIWAEEFLRTEQHVIHGDVPTASVWSSEMLDQPHFMGAGPSYEAEWEKEWNQLTFQADQGATAAPDPIAQTASQIVDSMKDPKFANSEFMNKLSTGEETLEPGARSTAAYGNSNWAEEFLVDGIVKEPETSTDLDWTKELLGDKPDMAEQWEKEFTGPPSGESFRADAPRENFWSQLQEEWDKAALENPSNYSWLETPRDSSVEYAFEAENPYKDHGDPYNAGLQKKAEGDLPSAILLFESAVQKDPDHMSAWEALAFSLAENEQDPGAIAAYKRCLALEPSNLVAIMGLAVSYTNESYQLQACQALEDWLRNNPKYAHIVSGPPPGAAKLDSSYSSLVSGETFNRVQDLYMQAARLQPSGDLDPDVQTGLGVLLNLSGDFDKAPDCFRAALQMRPNDSLLWNRLGATLANGGKSEEAVEAYYKALELSPGFIRARYNLAVSCINLGAHKEAAEHLVSALLAQAKSSKRVMSDNIWSTLRMVMNLMNRREFIPDIDARDLSRVAKEFGVTD
nr:EOG090X054E [Macrothrix elegans]